MTAGPAEAANVQSASQLNLSSGRSSVGEMDEAEQRHFSLKDAIGPKRHFTPANYCIAKGSLALLRHGVFLVIGAPVQLPSLVGQEHGRTILADIGFGAWLHCRTSKKLNCGI
jgi:hypothetical protein